MSNNIFPATILTGGTDGCLDAYDGDLLSDGDAAIVITTAGTYTYKLDATSAAAEDLPSIIAPDTNAIDKRWILQAYVKAGDADTVDGKHDYDFAPAAHAATHVGGADDIGLATTEADGLMSLEDKAYLATIQGFKNKLINPEFMINGRGVAGSVTTNASWPCDQWKTLIDAESTINIAKNYFPLGSTDLPFFVSSFLVNNFAGGIGVNKYVIVESKMEYVPTLANTTITLSFWAKASTAGKKMGASLRQYFGTGGSPSAYVDVASRDVALIELSTTWRKFTRTFDVPSIVNKTIGTDNNSCTALFLWFSDGANAYDALIGALGPQTAVISFAAPQLEYGAVATSFEFRPYQIELSLCQRYFEINYMRWSGITVSGATYFTQNGFKTMKRTSPTGVYTPTTAAGFANSAGTVTYSAWGNTEVRTSNGASNSGGWSCILYCSAEL